MAENKLPEGFIEELDWDSVIEEESEYVLLPDGVYDFVVTKVAKSHYEPKRAGSKIPPCKMAEITCKITSKDGLSTTCSRNLYITKSMEWLLSEFFISIGQKKHGEPCKMDWGKVEGSSGILKLGKRKGSGEYADKEYNDIKKFLEPGTKPTDGGESDW